MSIGIFFWLYEALLLNYQKLDRLKTNTDTMKKLYILFLFACTFGFAQNPGDIVITEIMNDPVSVSDTFGEYFEIYNQTASPIDIVGWTLKDDGTDTYVIVSGGESGTGTTIVPAGGYLVLGRSDDTMVNGGASVDYSYGDSGHTLGNGADEIVLLNTSMVEIARVNYDGGVTFPDTPGASISLDPSSLNETDNDNGSNWCLSTTPYGDGDLGTPGTANSACAPTCQTTLGASDTVCDSSNPGATDDTYSVTLDFSGAATGETFVVSTTPSGFTIGGDDPTSTASGTITVSGVTEGTDITITVSNTGDGGLCDLTRDITSPVCIPINSVDLELIGIIDFTVLSGGSDGKAIHLRATADIADLSIYGIGVANNGGGTDGQEYTFPAIAVSNGDHILLARSLTAMEAFLTTPGYNLFDVYLEDSSEPSQNGDDAIELFKNGVVVETFGDIDCRPSSDGTTVTCPNYQFYEDAWAYKDNGTWTYGAAQCTDYDTGNVPSTWTTFDTPCVYPFVAALSTQEFSEGELSIFPNPVSNGNLTIKSKFDGEMKVKIYDIMGRQVLTAEMKTESLDVSSLRPGLYLLNVSLNNLSSTRKLIIE